MRRWSVKLRNRTSSHTRCVVCHDLLAGPIVICTGCRTAFHEECRTELRRCSTLGCPAFVGDFERAIAPEPAPDPVGEETTDAFEAAPAEPAAPAIAPEETPSPEPAPPPRPAPPIAEITPPVITPPEITQPEVTQPEVPQPEVPQPWIPDAPQPAIAETEPAPRPEPPDEEDSARDAAFAEGAALPRPRAGALAWALLPFAIRLVQEAIGFAFTGAFVFLIAALFPVLIAEDKPLWGLLPLLSFVPAAIYFGKRLARRLRTARALARALRTGARRRLLVTVHEVDAHRFARFRRPGLERDALDEAGWGSQALGERVPGWLATLPPDAPLVVGGAWEGAPLVLALEDGSRVHVVVE